MRSAGDIGIFQMYKYFELGRKYYWYEFRRSRRQRISMDRIQTSHFSWLGNHHKKYCQKYFFKSCYEIVKGLNRLSDKCRNQNKDRKYLFIGCNSSGTKFDCLYCKENLP